MFAWREHGRWPVGRALSSGAPFFMSGSRARLKTMKTLLLCLSLFLVATAAQADIYTWVDAQGVRHYSDSAAQDGARRANLPGLQSVEGNPQALRQLQARAANNDSDSPAGGDSRTPQIVSPEPEQTFRDGRGIVPVSVLIGGAAGLRNGEQVTYYLDGSPIPQSPTDQTQLQLGNVPRGAHTLSAALLYEGTELGRTAPVTFYMQPPSAISPLNAGQGGDGGGNADTPPGGTSAPAAGNSAGAPAAPRFNTSTGAAPPS